MGRAGRDGSVGFKYLPSEYVLAHAYIQFIKWLLVAMYNYK